MQFLKYINCKNQKVFFEIKSILGLFKAIETFLILQI